MGRNNCFQYLLLTTRQEKTNAVNMTHTGQHVAKAGLSVFLIKLVCCRDSQGLAVLAICIHMAFMTF